MTKKNKQMKAFLLIILCLFVSGTHVFAETKEIGGSASVDGQITFFEGDGTKQSSPLGTNNTSGDKKNYLPQTGDNMSIQTKVIGFLIIGAGILLKKQQGRGCRCDD